MAIDWKDPRQLQRLVRRVALLIGAALLAWGFADLTFATIALADDSTPSVEAGARVLVRTLAADDGELQRGAIYLFDPTGRATGTHELRMARLFGLPGDVVAVRAAIDRPMARVEIWGESRSLPRELAELLPERVPAGHVLLFTDNPACRHLDSRALGPVAAERLRLRVLLSLRGLPRS